MRLHNFILASVIVVSACNKEDDLPGEPMSVIPEIELISTGPSTVVALKDSIEFLLHYQDGDGDLGYNSPDSLSIYITDNRIGLTEALFVPLLAPEDASVSIQGELLVELHNTILIDPDADTESVTFSIYLRDRTGNVSNTVTSAPITVFRE